MYVVKNQMFSSVLSRILHKFQYVYIPLTVECLYILHPLQNNMEKKSSYLINKGTTILNATSISIEESHPPVQVQTNSYMECDNIDTMTSDSEEYIHRSCNSNESDVCEEDAMWNNNHKLRDDSKYGDGMENDVRPWILKYNISYEAASNLLKILEEHHPKDRVPKNVCTLLKTKHNINITTLTNDSTFHSFGLKYQLLRELERYGNITAHKISFDVNVDGLPIFESSQMSFGPILCGINEIEGNPLIVAFFCEKSKPPLELYLQEFIEEVSGLQQEMIMQKTVKYVLKFGHLYAILQLAHFSSNVRDMLDMVAVRNALSWK